MHGHTPRLCTVIPALPVITAAILLSLAGCAAQRAALPGVMVHSEMGFQRGDYEVLQTAKGQGCVTFVGLFPLPFFFITSEDYGADLFGVDVGGTSREIAVYKAIQSIPDADALIIPRFHDEIKIGGIWYHQVCSTVTGKAIRFKTDYALYGRPPAAPPQPQLQYAPQPQQPAYQPQQYAPQPAQPPAAYPAQINYQGK